MTTEIKMIRKSLAAAVLFVFACVQLPSSAVAQDQTQRRTPEERQQARERWQKMSPEEREKSRAEARARQEERLKAMTPEQRADFEKRRAERAQQRGQHRDGGRGVN
jgi:type II secretory pathway component PulL